MNIAAIIPAFNRATATVEAVESILSQTRAVDEIIVVDDGSTDDTRERIREFGDRVTYLHQENQGQGPARNLGVSATTSDWIAFLDSDDLWDPAKIERQIAFIEQTGVAICFHDFRLQNTSSGTLIESWRRHTNEAECTNWVSNCEPLSAAKLVVGFADVFFTSTLVVRREVFQRAGGYRPEFRRCQDVDLHIRLLRYGRFGFLNEVLATKRESTPNATTEMTYSRRLEAIRRHMVWSMWERDAETARFMRARWLRELRCLAGHYRRCGEWRLALRHYAMSLAHNCLPLSWQSPVDRPLESEDGRRQ